MSETRNAQWLEVWEGQDESVVLTAIPWCLSHDDMASWDDLDENCWAAKHNGERDECVISRGGPDHPAWRIENTDG